MRKQNIIFLLFCTIIIKNNIYSRLFFVGSNPGLSIIAYPQDLFFFENDYISYSIGYQPLPWWGDVDEPVNKPNDTYTSTEENITFVKSSDNETNSYFKQYGSISHINNKIEYFKIWNKTSKSLFSLQYKLKSMYGNAEGILKATDSNTIFIPFNFNVNHIINNFYFENINSFKFFEIPFGVKLGFGFDNTILLTNSFWALLNNTNITSQRLFWGWTTVGCNHIFGFRHINGDSWFQDSYAIGPIYQFDLQIGATFPTMKIGNRLRYITGKQDSYYWQRESTNTLIENNFSGKYIKSDISKEINNIINRTYLNYNWWKEKFYKINTLFFLGIDSLTLYNVYSENPQIRSDIKQTSMNYIIEVNPNININFDHGFLMDAALLCEFSYKRLENTYPAWVNVGRKYTYWNTYVYPGDEYWLENYSYANETFYDIGFDTSLQIPIYKKDKILFAINLILFENTKFTYFTKVFGTNEINNNDVQFREVNFRNNFKREIWFNSTISGFFKYDRWIYRIDFIQPLIYSLYSKTSVLDVNNVIKYNNEKNRQWAVQEGPNIQLTISFEL